MLLLIDTRDRRPEPDPVAPRPAWEPNWRLWRWVALTVVAFAGAGATAALVAYVLICAGVACACKAVCELLPDTFGLKDYRQ